MVIVYPIAQSCEIANLEIVFWERLHRSRTSWYSAGARHRAKICVVSVVLEDFRNPEQKSTKPAGLRLE